MVIPEYIFWLGDPMARPAQFDPDEALQRSLLVFWRQGWAGTSIEDLVEATGVNRHSLYARWTDKHGLYQAALAHYFDTVGATWLAPLADERVPPLTAVRSTPALAARRRARRHRPQGLLRAQHAPRAVRRRRGSTP
jgi:AcrR family transcriptional regulator